MPANNLTGSSPAATRAQLLHLGTGTPGAATIRAALQGVEVLGIRDGFQWLMQGDVAHVRPLTIDDVSRIHFRGGSHIGISRANPTKDPRQLENTVRALEELGVSQVITIGGDDTILLIGRGREAAERLEKTLESNASIENTKLVQQTRRRLRSHQAATGTCERDMVATQASGVSHT